ncbi:MAG TPA: glycosyltransferase [Candidatus Nanoarchaeia archaeon]|nr:glycosyltransferase [Candidatus Nanoarchaeia archaeon]
MTKYLSFEVQEKINMKEKKIAPKFSIVIALAPDRGAEVLKSLENVDYDKKKMEIIIKKGLNPSENRNNGVRDARGEIIAFIDDDAVVDKHIFTNADEFFNKHPETDMVGGPQLTPEDDGFFAKTSGLVLQNYFGTSGMSYRYKQGKEMLDADETYLTSANCFIKRESFLKTTGFSPLLFPGEDPEFFTRIKKEGLRLAYSPELVVYHRRRANLKGFLRQFYKYGKVRCLKERLNKERVNFIFLAPMFFVFYIFAGGLLGLIVHNLFLMPILLYLLIDFIVSLWVGLNNGVHRIPLLFVLFFLLHVSYGLGMIGYFLNKAFKGKNEA